MQSKFLGSETGWTKEWWDKTVSKARRRVGSKTTERATVNSQKGAGRYPGHHRTCQTTATARESKGQQLAQFTPDQCATGENSFCEVPNHGHDHGVVAVEIGMAWVTRGRSGSAFGRASARRHCRGTLDRG